MSLHTAPGWSCCWAACLEEELEWKLQSSAHHLVVPAWKPRDPHTPQPSMKPVTSCHSHRGSRSGSLHHSLAHHSLLLSFPRIHWLFLPHCRIRNHSVSHYGHTFGPDRLACKYSLQQVTDLVCFWILKHLKYRTIAVRHPAVVQSKVDIAAMSDILQAGSVPAPGCSTPPYPLCLPTQVVPRLTFVLVACRQHCCLPYFLSPRKVRSPSLGCRRSRLALVCWSRNNPIQLWHISMGALGHCTPLCLQVWPLRL